MESSKPKFEAKLGQIRLACFENTTSDGRRWWSVSPSRRYYTDADRKEPKYATTFNGVADLVLLREAINQTIAWLAERQAEVNNGGEEEPHDEL